MKLQKPRPQYGQKIDWKDLFIKVKLSKPLTIKYHSALGLKNNNTKAAGHGDVHNWIRLLKGKAQYCAINKQHKSKRFEWANISRKYLYNLSDWMPLCCECHHIFDKGNYNVSEFKHRQKTAELKFREYKAKTTGLSCNMK